MSCSVCLQFALRNSQRLLRFAVVLLLRAGVFAQLNAHLLQAAPGDPDPTFGSGGSVIQNLGAGVQVEKINAIARQPADGKIVAAGLMNIAGIEQFTVVRYNADGSLDSSFGTSG